VRLSKLAYYSDFGVYAVAVCGAILWAITWSKSSAQLEALAAALVGMAFWTLAEYALHRFVLHGDSPFAKLHARHHAEPNAFIGTPTWLSAGIILALVFLPAWLAFSIPVAAGLSVGFALAFLWYGIAHHLVHHRPLRLLATFMQAAARRHYQHHNSMAYGNFGVTTELWDRIFGTQLAVQPAKVLRGRVSTQ
jgi:sterol desaturase/sphingolipid hydroxylase (fatty acid hydroxylase superfamily)